MRVAVTGGTGFVGREIVRRLQEQGHTPCLLVRPSSPRLPASTETRLVSFDDVSSLTQALEECEALLHLIGIIVETRGATYRSVHVDATSHLLAASRRAGVGRFIHMSALGTRLHARSRYHQTKWEAEELVRSSELKWTIFRPSLIYGPGDQFVNRFAAFMRFPLVPLIGDGNNLLQPIAVETVAQAFVGSLTHSGSVETTYDLCGPERLSMKQIVQSIAQTLHQNPWLFPVPIPLAWWLGALFEKISPRPLFNRDQVRMLEEDNVGEEHPATATFALQHELLAQGLTRFLRP